MYEVYMQKGGKDSKNEDLLTKHLFTI